AELRARPADEVRCAINPAAPPSSKRRATSGSKASSALESESRLTLVQQALAHPTGVAEHDHFVRVVLAVHEIPARCIADACGALSYSGDPQATHAAMTTNRGGDAEDRGGDAEQIELRRELAARHHDAFAWALNCCRRNRTEAEEVLQATYLKVLEGRARFVRRSSGDVMNDASKMRSAIALIALVMQLTAFSGCGSDSGFAPLTASGPIRLGKIPASAGDVPFVVAGWEWRDCSHKLRGLGVIGNAAA
ncbi:MAG: hypothetical protein ACREVR_17765, partial [Burkholderiales bacterium]